MPPNQNPVSHDQTFLVHVIVNNTLHQRSVFSRFLDVGSLSLPEATASSSATQDNLNLTHNASVEEGHAYV